jgi:hypothetical protein
MKSHNAIETVYSGYRFRSRLEARWAVAFDSIGHSWWYEHEGFELPSGRYLPDFYLPGLQAWAEVKPVDLTKEELVKCAELVACTEKPCILLIGTPEPTNYYFLHGGPCDYYSRSCLLFNPVSGIEIADCDLWWRPNRFYVCTGYDSGYDCPMERSLISTNEEPSWAAKSARFEFGESGK